MLGNIWACFKVAWPTKRERKLKKKVCILDEGLSSLSFPITQLALYKIDYKDRSLKSWEKIAGYPLQFE